jgi:hypothetical protein
MKPVTDVVYMWCTMALNDLNVNVNVNEESWNIFRSVLAKQSCSLAFASSDHLKGQ